MRERAVGAFDRDPRTRPEAGHSSALVADSLDGYPDVWRLRQRGEGVRMRVPPQIPDEEAPEEELTAGYGKTVEVPAIADDGEDAGRLGANLEAP